MTSSSKTSDPIITFGCRLNIYESEIIRSYLNDNDEKESPPLAISNTCDSKESQPIFILNTCAVTQEAERQARKTLRRIEKENPSSRVIVTGCAAQINPQQFENFPQVIKILGNSEKLNALNYQDIEKDKQSPVLNASAPTYVSHRDNIKNTAHHLITGFENHSRAFLQIQQGCSHRCTFCIIPYTRGDSYSIPVDKILQQTHILLDQGYQEIVLTGINLTSYGTDISPSQTLGKLVEILLEKFPNLPRLRLSSLDPKEIDLSLLHLWKEKHPRLAPHIHLSVQAGDDLILKRMKRRHLRQDVIELTNNLLSFQPQLIFGADLIAGFPTETSEMFHNTLNLIDEAHLSLLHTFSYSSRPGTPASRMPPVDPQAIKSRGKILFHKKNTLFQDRLAKAHNTTAHVLLESNGCGLTEHFLPATFHETIQFSQQDIGKIIPVRLCYHENEKKLYALPIHNKS